MYNFVGTKCFGLNEASLPLASGSRKRKLANQCTTPDRYMQAFRDGSRVTEICLPLKFNAIMKCYFSMHAEDALFGANFDVYIMKWTGASQVNPEYQAVAMEKAMRWASLSAEEATEPVLTTFALPWWDDKGSSYARCYHTTQCKQLQQLTEASSGSMPQDTGLMNKTSGAPQSGMSIS